MGKIETIKCVGYIRKSPDDKEDTKTSLNNQKKTIIITCDGVKEWELVGMYSDAHVSGSDRKRKELNKMMERVYSSDIKIILVKTPDRFARDTAFYMDTLDRMTANGKKLYSCIDKKFVSSEDLGDNIRSFLDGQYVRDQRKKAELTLELKRLEGKPIGNPIFGYKYNMRYNSSGEKIPVDKQLAVNEWIVNEKEAKIVLRVVVDYLQKRDYKATMKDYAINKSKYYRIVNHASKGLYSGFVSYERKFRNPDKTVARIEKVTYKAKHKSILPEELYKKLEFEK